MNRVLSLMWDEATEEIFLGTPGTDRNGAGNVLFFPNRYPLSSRELRLSDNGRTLDCSLPITLTVPAGLPVGFYCFIAQTATGAIQVRSKPGSGVTINGSTAGASHAVTPPSSPQLGALFSHASLLGGPIVLQATAQDVYSLSVAAPGALVNA